MRPTGIWFATYTAESRSLETRRSRVAGILLLVSLAALPLAVGPWLLGELTFLFITLIAVYGLYVTVGMAGQINIAQSAFVGVGAFATAKLSGMGLPFWLCIPAAALITGAVSVLFALPAIRVRGFYLALTTLAAQVMFPIIVMALPMAWLGGLVGLPVVAPQLAGINLGTTTGLYYLALVLVLFCTWAVFNIPYTRFGRALKAVHDNDTAADVMGIPVARIKIEAFFAGALFAGVAGALTAYSLQFVAATNFTLFASVWYLGMLIVGGMHSPLGAILGVLFITLLQEGLHTLGNIALQTGGIGGTIFAVNSVVLALCILLALIFEPRGLAHLWNTTKTAFRFWPFPRT